MAAPIPRPTRNQPNPLPLPLSSVSSVITFPLTLFVLVSIYCFRLLRRFRTRIPAEDTLPSYPFLVNNDGMQDFPLATPYGEQTERRPGDRLRANLPSACSIFPTSKG